MNDISKEWKIRALTPIWTGDADREENRLIPTGIVGSLRWWFEVLVRGLGGKACDPTVDGVRCPDKNVKNPYDPGQHCVVCEFFGCTGWARKFRLMVVNENGTIIQGQIKDGQIFILRFIPLRLIRDEEWCLLDATLRLIADYGAIGGKTVFKPSEEWGIADLGADDLDDSNGQVKVKQSRRGLPLQRDDVILEVEGVSVTSKSSLEQLLIGKQHGEPLKIKIRRSKGDEEEINAWAGKRHHRDFGLISIEERPQNVCCNREVAETYVQQAQWRRNFDDSAFAWASLQNFWCVKGRYLTRTFPNASSFNKVIGRNQLKANGQNLFQNTEANRWLAGRQQESKKVFSFKHRRENGRTFGFVKPGLVDFDEMKRRLKQVWPNFEPDNEFQTGEQILNELF
ncbi:MAG: hypothetical protein KatS3mg045_1390 [Bellilinea sp.]|nr:MAG: hypothetical protein KatS3mg045_1390 [Bellilinea sp.]